MDKEYSWRFTFLHEVLDQWRPFFIQRAELPKINVVYVDASASDELPTSGAYLEIDDQYSTGQQSAGSVNASAHATITANLEQMHAKLGSLIERWKLESPEDDGPQEDHGRS